ncbi:MAG TPA: methylated-DNA--[protein]-cysteine S-methyltransferase [Firmicutes bacterium]|nr:methylated-DNA--[protein]-cysteine S-methyltransferase [Bacillota bacterium]
MSRVVHYCYCTLSPEVVDYEPPVAPIRVLVAWSERGICRIDLGGAAPPGQGQIEFRRYDSRQVELTRLLEEWLARGDDPAITAIPLDLSGLTLFTKEVLSTVRTIPRGEIRSYRWVAREIGRPRAIRAVGQALRANPIPLLIPCHRVVPARGGVGGYSGGMGPEFKKWLLRHEGITPPFRPRY